jgi:hypothetical protein
MPLGLSSLGRCEARVLENLDAVIASLAAVAGEQLSLPAIRHPRPGAFYRGNRFLRRHTEAVFGPTPAGRQVRIMVTLPSEAAEDYSFVRELVERGTDVVRINCAHDTAEKWAAMASNARRAADESGRSCRVLIDLEGPRARTGRVAGRAAEVVSASVTESGWLPAKPSGRPIRRRSSARCRRPSHSFCRGTTFASTRAGSASSPKPPASTTYCSGSRGSSRRGGCAPTRALPRHRAAPRPADRERSLRP